MLLETSSPWARLMVTVLALLTVAARFSVGEHASSSGDTGAGKLLWLNRPSLSALADIALVMSVPGPSGLHGFQGCTVLQVLATRTWTKVWSLGVALRVWKSRSGRCKQACLDSPSKHPRSEPRVHTALQHRCKVDHNGHMTQQSYSLAVITSTKALLVPCRSFEVISPCTYSTSKVQHHLGSPTLSRPKRPNSPTHTQTPS